MSIVSRSYVLSAELAHLADDENNRRHDALRAQLARLLIHGQVDSIMNCRGAYKGTPELSVLVHSGASQGLAEIVELAKAFGQESILAISPNDVGLLHYLDGRAESVEVLGSVEFVTSTSGLDAWTQIIGTGETFTIR